MATRLFFMQARMFGLPVEALHAYVDEQASMRVKVVSLLRMVNARGPEFTGRETVTLFNDMCVMAPATLIDPAIRWEPVDAKHARASFTAARVRTLPPRVAARPATTPRRASTPTASSRWRTSSIT